MPYGIRKGYMPAIKALRNVRSFVLPLTCYEGEELSSGEHLKIAYLGWDERVAHYWLKRFFRRSEQSKGKFYVPVWKIKNYLLRNTSGYDLAIMEAKMFTRRFIPSREGFVLPRWLEMQIDIEKTLHILGRSEYQRLIRKNDLTYEKRSSEADFRLFYEKMYLPYISIRHKDAAVLADYKQFLNNIFRKKGSQMYFIIKEGIPVAGSIDEIKKDFVRMSGIGILDGREDLLRMGVIPALYYFQSLEYKRRKIRSVNIGGSSPILTDGLTQFKYSIGAQLFETIRKCETYVGLIPLTRSRAIRKVFSANPVISINEKLYQRNIFVDPEEEDMIDHLQNILKRTSFDYIRKTKIFCFNNSEIVRDWIHNRGYQGIEVLNI
jgi:hypothetical protein